MIVLQKRLASLLFLLATCATSHAEDVTWDGSESSDWYDGQNWDNETGPIEGDVTIIPAGTVDYSSGVSPNFRTLHLLGGTMNLTGGEFKANFQSSWNCIVDGTFFHSAGIADLNELEVGKNLGTSGFYKLSGGELIIGRGLNGFSLYLGGNHDSNPSGTGTFQISAGSMATRTGVKLGHATVAGTGTFEVLGSAATAIHIGSQGSLDGWWEQNSGSTLKLRVDYGGLTKIFIDDVESAGATYATFESGSLLDVGYYNAGAPGTWTVMEVENGDIVDNGLAFAPGVNTSIWSFNIDNSGANGILTVTSTATAPAGGNIVWDGSESTDWRDGLNWDNNFGPYTAGDRATINSGTVVYSSGTGANLRALRLQGGELTISGGTFKSTFNPSWDSHVNGILHHTGGTTEINELEVGRTSGTNGMVHLSGGDFAVTRALNGNSLYLGGNHDTGVSGNGTFEISGGSFITRAGVKLGDASVAGTGTFAVLGSAASEIGIGTRTGDSDGSWFQSSGSTLKARIDYTGLTKIFIDDSSSDTTGTSATFAAGSLLDVGYHITEYGGGTWTIMEVENGPIIDNGLAFAPGVNTNVWSFSIDNSGSNGLLKVTAVGSPAGLQLNVGNTTKQQMRYGIDYERLWFWTGSNSVRDEVAKWSVADCDVDYVRVAINAKYELTEGVYQEDAYFDNDDNEGGQTSNDRIIPMMQDMKDANPNIKFFASPRPLNEAVSNASWQPYPIWITGAPSYNSSSFDFQWQKCAEYLVRYLLLMKSNGFQISYLDITNEWQSNVGGGRITQDDMDHIHNYLHVTYMAAPWPHPALSPTLLLEPQDIPEIVAPSSWNYSQGTSWINNLDSGDKEAISIAASHNTDRTGDAQAFADMVHAELGTDTEIWNTEVHGWKSTSGADEVLTSAFMFECIRAGFSGLNGWLARGTSNQGHCYILNTTRNVKYYMFQKLTNTSNRGYALDINQPSEFEANVHSDTKDANAATAALIRGNLMTVWVLNHSSNTLPVIINPSGRTISDHPIRSTRWSEVAGLPVEGVVANIDAISSTQVYSTVEASSVYCFEILLDPIGQPMAKIEAEDFNLKSGMDTESCSDLGGGQNLSYIKNGNWACYENLAPGDDAWIRLRVARPVNQAAGKIEVRLDSPTGPLIGEIDVPETGGWQTWETIETQLDPVVGTHTIYLKFVELGSPTNESMFNLNWLSITQLAAPDGLVATTAGTEQIDLTWNASVGATSYNLQRSTTSGGPYTPVVGGQTTNTSLTDSGLTPGTEYFYVVTAVYPEGEGIHSTEDSASTTIAAPASPTGLAATIANATQIDLTWDAIPGATSYSLKRSTTQGGSYAPVGSVATTSTTDGGLTPGTRYYYVVSALNAGGESLNSAEASAVPSDPIVPGDAVISSAVIGDDGMGGEEMKMTIDQTGLGQFYQVLATDDLANPTWQPIGPVKLGNGSSMQFEAPIDSQTPRRFYKIKVWRE